MSFTYKTPIVVDHTKCGASDSANFPVLVSGTYPRLATVAHSGHAQNANGYDIRPYADSSGSTALTFELVSYNATTGYVEMWVRVPTLSHSVDTTIYLFYGDAALTTDGSSATTWSSNFKAVYHLGDGSTLSLADSTSNALNLTNHGSWGAAAGKVGGGTALSDGTTQYLSDTALASPNSVTISFWNKVATGDPNGDWAISIGIGSSGARVLTHAPFTDNNLYWDYGNATAGSGRVSTSYAAYLDAWALVTLVYDSATEFHGIYLNGALVVSNIASVANPGLTGLLVNTDAGITYGKRKLDEIRISDVARSADWILAEYNSQNSPSTFYSVGSESPLGANPTSDFTTSMNLKVVTLTDASTPGTNPITSYDTDWGDGTTHMTTASGSHTYAVAGQYTITHTVSDGVTPSSVSHDVITTTRHGYGLSRNPSGPAASATADVNDV